MQRTTLGVGFIGAGPVTQAIHLPTLARMPDLFHVAHVVDISAEIAADVARRVSAVASTSLDELLADPGVDVVAVCSPHQFHAEQAIAACHAGKKAVLCEKPLAMGVGEAQAIATASVESGVPVIVGSMHVYDSGWLAATTSGFDVTQVHTVRSSIVLPPNPRFEDWATEVLARPSFPPADLTDPQVRAQMLHAGVMGLAIHDVPLIRQLLGSTDALQVRSADPSAPFGYQIVATVGDKRLELHASMSSTWQPDWVLDAYTADQSLSLSFTPSYVHAGSATATVCSAGRRHSVLPAPGNGYQGEWQFLSAVVAGRQPAPEAAELVADLTFALALAEGAAQASNRRFPVGAVA